MNKLKKVIIICILLFIIVCFKINVYGVTIVLDPGHGGSDSGAIAKNGEYEKELNMKVANYLKEYLSNYKVDVYLTHSSTDDNMNVFNRGIYNRNKNADIGISLHFNSATKAMNGAEIYVTNNTSLPKYKANCTDLGNLILGNLSMLGIQNRGVKTRLCTGDSTDAYTDGTRADYYGFIRYSMRGCKIDYGKITPQGAVPANVQKGQGTPAIIIEHCFLIGSDYQFINSDSKLKKIAEADGRAIVEYYKLSPKVVRKNIEPFKDVFEDDWYAEVVKYVNEKKILKGYNETTFAPKDKMSRAMLITTLWRMEGMPKTSLNVFKDVTEKDWYYESVNWAASVGIIKGYGNGKFGPKDNITREQISSILMNYAKFKKKNITARADVNKYTDYNKTANCFQESILWCIANKIISGKENGTKIDPKGETTRAEAAAMLKNYCCNVK